MFSKACSRSTIKSAVLGRRSLYHFFLMLTLDKKLSFIQHISFGRNNEVIKTANKISIMTLDVKHGTQLGFNVIRVLKKNVLTFCLHEILMVL